MPARLIDNKAGSSSKFYTSWRSLVYIETVLSRDQQFHTAVEITLALKFIANITSMHYLPCIRLSKHSVCFPEVHTTIKIQFILVLSIFVVINIGKGAYLAVDQCREV